MLGLTWERTGHTGAVMKSHEASKDDSVAGKAAASMRNSAASSEFADRRASLQLQQGLQKQVDESSRLAQLRRQTGTIDRGHTAQLRSLAPSDSTGTALVRAGGTASRDEQAPQTLSRYDLALNAVAGRDAALAAIRTEYTALGTSLGAGAEYISRNKVNTWRGANAANGAALYDRLRTGGVAIPNAAPATNQGKSNSVAGFADWNSRANLDHLLNWPAIPYIDPLKVVVTCPLNAGGNVSTTIEFTEAHRGYISNVAALGGNASMERTARYGDGNNGTRDGTSTVAALGTYSMTHHQDSATTLGQQMDAAEAAHSTLAAKEEGTDAVTKVVAEGGRFQCVAALGTAITNGTKFYVRLGLDPQPITYHYIDFKTLWLKWTSGFNKGYGIPNTAVRKYITDKESGVVEVREDEWPVDASPRVNLG